MKRNNFWRWIGVIFVVMWALVETYPPSDQPLIDVFVKNAVNKDARFDQIVKMARSEVATGTNTAYYALLSASSNVLENASNKTSLTNYFTTYNPDPDTDPNVYILNRIQRKAAGKIRLGIDLKGGTSFRLAMNWQALQNREETTNSASGSTNAAPVNALELASQRKAAISQAVEVLRRRVDRLGVAEPVIQPLGEDQIIVQLPGLSPAEMASAREQIQQAAFLEFRLVNPKSEELLKDGLIEPGYERMTETSVDKKGVKHFTDLLVSKRRVTGTIDGKQMELTGSHITTARVERNQFTGQPEIDFELDSTGAQLFSQITTENVGKQLAIILDGKLQSAPNIREPITGGRCQITGHYSDTEAEALANVLQNPLQAPLQLLSESRVDPTLGAETIMSGLRAALLGLVLVGVFMAVYYMLGGLVADAAVVLNMIILIGVLCSIKATLTLPGIAGIVLTIGMAVDANVLIFERVREELEAGKSLRGALDAGYDRAFGTIFDSNLTTLIASIILIALGTGSIKGFGYTLTIGIAASMFTALVFTRLIFDWLLAKGILKKLPMLSLIHGTRIDFLRLAKIAFSLSWIIIVVGMGYGIFFRGSEVLNHEFKGGIEVTFQFKKGEKIDQAKISDTVKQAVGIGEPTVQYQRDLTGGTESLVVKTGLINDKSLDEGKLLDKTTEVVINSLAKAYPDAGFKQINMERSGPSLGAEIQRSAMVSIFLSLFGILVYVAFRYEFSFAVGAVVAVIHDVLMTIGIYFLAGKQMSAPMVAAILTIIGFSINDTIVIFDRIREDLMLGKPGSFKQVMNTALNETLSRTIITSGTAFLATLALFLFGGGGLSDFSFTFLVGIITGTYSSIYIAAAIVLWWHKGQRPTLAAAIQPAVSGEAHAGS